ncbi:hypothetical protein EV699_10147 [Plasticicumulans lactativorans]|uniref:Uncharacterized protein n=1 Tax=Plasticicumulans lactativorans TaxID=1133106 RepID=A0A4R2LK64_9GAMM|nr:hypothetical protein [Plasticicumulans lactativorans]TCO83663.1 hypothetical protein EV699_10147 [Plasticicumulans lactativorans]
MGRYLLAWLAMIPLAIANGALRELGYARRMGERRAHQCSTLTAIVVFGAYIALVVRTWPPASAAQALAVGLLWLVLTVAFEFGFGHWGRGLPWRALLRDYDLRAGRLWPLFLAWLALAPWLFHRAGA